MERKSDLYRRSLTHRGGAYPLLRITARFLDADYRRIYVGFRSLPDGTAIICEDPVNVDTADAWGVLEFSEPIDPSDAARLVSTMTIDLGEEN